MRLKLSLVLAIACQAARGDEAPNWINTATKKPAINVEGKFFDLPDCWLLSEPVGEPDPAVEQLFLIHPKGDGTFPTLPAEELEKRRLPAPNMLARR